MVEISFLSRFKFIELSKSQTFFPRFFMFLVYDFWFNYYVFFEREKNICTFEYWRISRLNNILFETTLSAVFKKNVSKKQNFLKLRDLCSIYFS